MAKICEQCGKKPSVGRYVSHSNRKTLRRYDPNIVRKKLFDAVLKKMTVRKICTACMRTLVKTA